MKKILTATSFFVFSLIPGFIFSQSPGDLVITEFMANPAAVSDTDGEYLELYNITGVAIDINGFTLRDDDFDSHVIDNGGPLLVPALGFIVLGRNGDPAQNGGYTAQYQYSGFILGNSGDEIVLETAGAVEICRLDYTDGSQFGPGVSQELSDIALSVNGVTQPADYVAATAPYGLGDLGSPGSAGNTQGTGGGDPPPSITNVSRSPRIPDHDENTTVSADVTDDSQVTLVELRYSVNDGSTQSVTMPNIGGNTYSADIPQSAYSNADRVEYWIYAEDDAPQSSESFHFKFFVGTTPIANLHPVDLQGVLLYNGYDALISGVASAESGIFQTDNIDVYLQDASGGINLFIPGVSHSDYPIFRGNDYTVIGTVDQFNGKAEIVPLDTNDVGDNGPGYLPPPVVRTIAQFKADPETYEGMFTAIAQVINTGGGDPWPPAGSSANIEIVDGSGDTLILRIDSDTDIDGTPEPSWPVNVQGIFSQFDFSLPFTDGYQLMPRDVNDFDVSVGIPGSINNPAIAAYRLYANFPNPFNPQTTIRYDLRESGTVEFQVYNTLGESVFESSVYQNSGTHHFVFDGSQLPSGIYYYMLKSNDFNAVKKMVLVK